MYIFTVLRNAPQPSRLCEHSLSHLEHSALARQNRRAGFCVRSPSPFQPTDIFLSFRGQNVSLFFPPPSQNARVMPERPKESHSVPVHRVKTVCGSAEHLISAKDLNMCMGQKCQSINVWEWLRCFDYSLVRLNIKKHLFTHSRQRHLSNVGLSQWWETVRSGTFSMISYH